MTPSSIPICGSFDAQGRFVYVLYKDKAGPVFREDGVIELLMVREKKLFRVTGQAVK